MAKQDLILLAMDPSPSLELLVKALRASNFDLVLAHDRGGLDKLTQNSIPALAVIGDSFAKQDGFSIAAGMLERFPTMPIVLYSEGNSPDLAVKVLKAGITGYIHPPLTIEEIVEEIRRALKRARTLGDWVRREVKRTTASLEQKARISESERVKLEAIISNIQDGVLVLDEQHHILIANQTIYEMFSLDGTPIVGKYVKDVIPNADLSALIDRARDGILKYHEINFDDGRVFNAQYTPLARIGSAVTMQDISYLKEIDRLKNEFVHTVSHDLRSPLTAILGYMELIERVGSLNDSQRDFLNRLQASVQHMTSLVNELLDVGRLEAGFDTRREVVDISNLFEYSLTVFDSQIRKKNLRLTVDHGDTPKSLRANPIRIRQMIDNLIGNAIKYTPPGGEIRVSISSQDNQVILQVSDSGPGIPPDEQNRVFEKFYRASNRPGNVEGSGLGLAIVKSIVESHHGRVWVESKVGVGSTFIVLLPVHE
ncbi:MAG: PAS domain-containing protein [Chloroflexi bacterium CFX2]|nr:PAS domain-containing protein [Chloroflexi bacterium CFX2]